MDTTLIVDLDGRTMLPGFVDSHGHAYMVGLQASVANLLPPPDAEVDSIDVLVATLARWAEQNQYAVERVGWIIGFGYDNAQLAEHRHPTRDDLDLVSVDVPVIVVHQSGHVGSANSKALEVAGITAETEDPPGGRFERRDGSNEPNGFAEEYAFFALIGRAAQNFDDKVNDVFVERGASLLASYGYTTAQEGRAIGLSLEAMKRVADAGKLPIDLVAYPDILEVEDIKPSMTYTGRYRVGGVKLTIDGSPQGKTAWLSQPYHVPPPGMPPEYVGYPAITPEQTHGAFEKAYANGWQIITHANGDAAIDALIGAVKLAQRNHPEVDNRPVLIHGQTLRHDQVAQLDALGVFPSLFPMHTFYWGDYPPRLGARARAGGEHLSHRLVARARHDVRLPPRCARCVA
jgi:predicted amidohydrolase YtcJ